MTISVERFLEVRPVLYHYTSPEGVERLRHLGLWCTKDILRRYGVAEEQVREWTTFPRFDSIPLDHPDYGPTRISHQKPMLTQTGKVHGKLLESLAMTNTSVEQFCTMLAERVFFFGIPHDWRYEKRDANGFVGRVLLDGPLCQVVISTTKLLKLCEAQGVQFEVSKHNAGSFPQGPALPKGRGTWMSLDQAGFAVGQVQEVVVVGSVDCLGDVIEDVVEVKPPPAKTAAR